MTLSQYSLELSGAEGAGGLAFPVWSWVEGGGDSYVAAQVVSPAVIPVVSSLAG